MSRVRIVGGSMRSRVIDVPESTGLRPTPDRVRETVFNWLGQELSGLNCLDLFAGSGAMGFEAASRGAASVVMVEKAPAVFAHLQNTSGLLKAPNVRLQRGDALEFLRATPERFDVIFLDPPYRQGWLERVAPLLPRVLAEDGRVYVEAETAVDTLAGLTAFKRGKAGQVHYQLLANEDTP